jgi:hypothetical protein
MAYINLAQMTKLARLQVLNSAIGANATIVIYDSMYPTSPDYPAVGNTLVTFLCSNLAFANVATVSTVVGNTIANVATLTSIAISNSNGNAIVDLDVGLPGSNVSTSIVMNSTDLIANIPVQIVSINITE